MAPKQIHPVGKANQMSAPREDNTPGDMLLGAIISCKPDRLRRRCSIVSAVSFDDPPLGMHGDIFDEKEFIFLKLKAAELETEYEVQRSRANKSELLLTTMREQNAVLERENARLKQEIQAANNLTKKLQEKILRLHRITRQKNVCSPPSQPNLSRSAASNSDESARLSFIDLLRQSFMPKEDLVNIEHEICTSEHEKKSEKRRLSCPSITDKVSKGGRRRFSFSNLSFSDVNFDPAEVDSIDY